MDPSCLQITSKAGLCQRSPVSWKFWASDEQRGTPEALPTCTPLPTACGFEPPASLHQQTWRMGVRATDAAALFSISLMETGTSNTTGRKL
ncbi:hypothetical protein CesoFtcFv8_026987 [Champsocephalus esox]|uniref:Uncharacterized protein n=1 Tax=Champsocephalus esox TaxID=159716 RepID=A0AAN8GCM1_9TELE|nr:hypothetical protein CesoFtcFv8_026987 [Champsocephalus esox]